MTVGDEVSFKKGTSTGAADPSRRRRRSGAAAPPLFHLHFRPPGAIAASEGTAMKSSITRRRFLGTAAAGVAATTIPSPPVRRSIRRHGEALNGWWRSRRIARCASGAAASARGAARQGGEAPRQPGPPADQRPALRARQCRIAAPLRSRSPEAAHLRVGARGEGKFKAFPGTKRSISWPQDQRCAQAKYGRESIAFFPHGVASGFFTTLMKAFGTPNSAEPAFSQCRGPREVGYSLTFGRPRVAGACRPGGSEAHRPDRFAHRRERFHIAGDRVQHGAGAWGEVDRCRSAVLGRRCKSRLVAADPAGYRYRASAGVDERTDRRRTLR